MNNAARKIALVTGANKGVGFTTPDLISTVGIEQRSSRIVDVRDGEKQVSNSLKALARDASRVL